MSFFEGRTQPHPEKICIENDWLAWRSRNFLDEAKQKLINYVQLSGIGIYRIPKYQRCYYQSTVMLTYHNREHKNVIFFFFLFTFLDSHAKLFQKLRLTSLIKRRKIKVLNAFRKLPTELKTLKAMTTMLFVTWFLFFSTFLFVWKKSHGFPMFYFIEYRLNQKFKHWSSFSFNEMLIYCLWFAIRV